MTRVLIPDLAPDTDYVLQVRVNDGESFGPWSRKFRFTTSGDFTIPQVVLGTAWNTSGTSFIGTWASVTGNTDGTIFNDFDHYEVEVSDGVTASTYNTIQRRFEFDFEMNRSAFSAPRATVTFRVRAVDQTGNVGQYSTLLSATNAAPNPPTGLTALPRIGAVQLRWNASTSNDVDGYNIYANSLFIAFTPATSYTFQTNSAANINFEVRAVDRFGTESTSAAITSAGTVLSGADTVAPKIPTGLDGTIVNVPGDDSATASLTWNAVTENADNTPLTDLAGYRLRFRQIGESAFTFMSVGNDTAANIPGLVPYQPYEFQIEAFDFNGNHSGYSASLTPTVPVNLPPSQPAAPTVSTNVMQAQVSVTGSKAAGGGMEGDVVAYEVYAAQNSGFTATAGNMLGIIDQGPAMSAVYPIPANSAPTWFFVIIAVDRSGLRSPQSPQAVGTPGLIANANIANATITDAKITNLDVNKLTAGTGIINDFTIKSTLTLGVSAGVPGVIKSWNYVAGTSGFSLNSNGLEIADGVVRARALAIQTGNNMMPAVYADFEGKTTAYDNMFTAGTVTIGVDDEFFRFNQHSLNIATDIVSETKQIWFSEGGPDELNIPMESNTKYIVSGYYWGKASAKFDVNIALNSGDTFTITSIDTAPLAAWTRFSGTVTTQADTTQGVLYLELDSTVISQEFNIDGLQVEPQTGNLNTPSQWSPPGITSVEGNIIRTGTVTADHLESEMLLTTNIYAGGLPGSGAGRVEIGPDGVFLVDADNKTVVSLPTNLSDTNPASFHGNGEFDGIEIIGDSSFGTGLNSILSLAPTTTMSLDNGITKPKQAPTVNTFVPAVSDTSVNTGSIVGAVKGASNIYYLKSSKTSSGAWLNQIVEFNSVLHSFVSLHTLAINEKLNSIAYNSGSFYILSDSGNFYMVNDTTFGVSSPRTSGFWNDNNSLPVIGNDFTGLGTFIVAKRISDNRVQIAHINWGASLTTVQMASEATPHLTEGLSLIGVACGNFDYGATRYIILGGSEDEYVVFSRSTTTLSTVSRNWDTVSGTKGNIRGFYWDGTFFHQVTFVKDDRTGHVLTNSTFGGGATANMSTATATWWLRYSWYNSLGPNETPNSVPRSFTIKRRRAVKVSTPVLPVTGGTDPDGARFYIHSGTSDNLDFTDYWRQTATPAPVAQIVLPVLSGTNGAQARTAFPAGAGAKITSADGTTTVIRADGTLTVGPTKFGAGNAAISGMDWGHHSGTTNGSGDITIPHDLGVTPTYVQVSNANNTNNRVECTGRTASNITVTYYVAAGTAVAGSLNRDTDWEVRV